MNFLSSLDSDIEHFLKEDGLYKNHYYIQNLPKDKVRCYLKIKSDMILSGLPYFFEVFKFLGANENFENHFEFEGKSFNAFEKEIEFELPFSLALIGERVSLNLLTHSSSIATFVREFVNKAKKYNIKILDTRKTTPGLRSLEKYSIVTGGGFNHRFDQSDVWMVKDNHKNFFGSIKKQ